MIIPIFATKYYCILQNHYNMDKQGFIEFNKRFSTDKSRKASSYARAIEILDKVLLHHKLFGVGVNTLYNVSNSNIIEDVLEMVNREVEKYKKGKPNIFDYDKNIPPSYMVSNFCSAALNSLIDYSQFETAEEIVAKEKDPLTISKKLIKHFGLKKDGEDVVYETKRRRGQEYFRRMILANYGYKCCITGLDVPEILLASHIVEWAKDKANRLNPENGLCLSATYDAAFDKHLISFDDDYRMIVSKHIKDYYSNDITREYFDKFEGKQIALPSLYLPSKILLEKHREALVV